MNKDEALKLALEALEANHLLIHGSETKGGVRDYIDGYYSGCFDFVSNKNQINEAITAIKEALAHPKHGWTTEQLAGIARLKEAQDKKLSQSKQEFVAWEQFYPDMGKPEFKEKNT